METFSGYCRIEIIDEDVVPDWLNDIHYRVMDNSVREIREFVDGAFLWFPDLFLRIRRGSKRVGFQQMLYLGAIVVWICFYQPDFLIMAFPPFSLCVRPGDVFKVCDLMIEIAIPFHNFKPRHGEGSSRILILSPLPGIVVCLTDTKGIDSGELLFRATQDNLELEARANVTIGFRSRVIRIQITETCYPGIIPIAACMEDC